MYWVIRWTNKQTGEDQSIVVEAKSKVVAETMALKRDIPIVFVGEAEESDVRIAREAKLLWQYTKEHRYTCFGQPIATGHLACFMLCGLWTIGVLLQTSHLIPALLRVHF